MIFHVEINFAVAKNKQSLIGFVVQDEYFDNMKRQQGQDTMK